MAVPPEILQNARNLRATQTDAENYLWFLLRNRSFCGFKFRRQHPVGRYILDFYCNRAQIAIELDGSGHAAQNQADYDRERSRELASAGITVLRFWNNDVFDKIEDVLEAIHRALFHSP